MEKAAAQMVQFPKICWRIWELSNREFGNILVYLKTHFFRVNVPLEASTLAQVAHRRFVVGFAVRMALISSIQSSPNCVSSHLTGHEMEKQRCF
jgi:hypothetical protein